MSWTMIDMPEPNDILFGRGGESNNAPGNRRYQKVLGQRAQEYAELTSRKSKTSYAWQIYFDLKKEGFRFLTKVKGSKLWVEAPEDECRKKISQRIREMALTAKEHEVVTQFADNTNPVAISASKKKSLASTAAWVEKKTNLSGERASFSDSLPCNYPAPEEAPRVLPGRMVIQGLARRSSTNSNGSDVDFSYSRLGRPGAAGEYGDQGHYYRQYPRKYYLSEEEKEFRRATERQRLQWEQRQLQRIRQTNQNQTTEATASRPINTQLPQQSAAMLPPRLTGVVGFGRINQMPDTKMDVGLGRIDQILNTKMDGNYRGASVGLPHWDDPSVEPPFYRFGGNLEDTILQAAFRRGRDPPGDPPGKRAQTEYDSDSEEGGEMATTADADEDNCCSDDGDDANGAKDVVSGNLPVFHMNGAATDVLGKRPFIHESQLCDADNSQEGRPYPQAQDQDKYKQQEGRRRTFTANKKEAATQSKLYNSDIKSKFLSNKVDPKQPIPPATDNQKPFHNVCDGREWFTPNKKQRLDSDATKSIVAAAANGGCCLTVDTLPLGCPYMRCPAEKCTKIELVPPISGELCKELLIHSKKDHMGRLVLDMTKRYTHVVIPAKLLRYHVLNDCQTFQEQLGRMPELSDLPPALQPGHDVSPS